MLIWSIKRMSVILCPKVHTYEAKWFFSLPESTRDKNSQAGHTQITVSKHAAQAMQNSTTEHERQCAALPNVQDATSTPNISAYERPSFVSLGNVLCIHERGNLICHLPDEALVLLGLIIERNQGCRPRRREHDDSAGNSASRDPRSTTSCCLPSWPPHGLGTTRPRCRGGGECDHGELVTDVGELVLSRTSSDAYESLNSRSWLALSWSDLLAVPQLRDALTSEAVPRLMAPPSI
jgi:hypothetical protein